jgi:predicted ATP-dependent endonuclease of OLD family
MTFTASPLADRTIESATDSLTAPNVLLACVEIQRFRRLRTVRVPIDNKTTILVGANNSGKTSIVTAMWQFLSDAPTFGACDLSADQWPRLRRLGVQWEELDKAPSSKDSSPLPWDQHLSELLSCMPALDLWFNAQPGAFHIISPFIPSLQWAGGPIGVRLRLEPASDVTDLQELAWHFREARQPVRTHDKSARSWPTDLLDYWLRHPKDLGQVVAYKLNPSLGPLAENPPAKPQELPSNAKSVERSKLAPLVKVDFIAAQRGLGAEEVSGRPGSDAHRVGLFSTQMLRFARRQFDDAGPGPGQHPDFIGAIGKAQKDLDEKVESVLAQAIEDVKILGYPGLHDPPKMQFRTRIKPDDLLNHSTAVQYRLLESTEDAFLPEHAIGLGYQNLQALSYQLVNFKELRLNPKDGSPAAVHLVLLEEPEAHLHVQVQRVFPKRAVELITSGDAKHAHLSSQLILTTHASHLAHAVSFTCLRYVRRCPPLDEGATPCSEVINLANIFGDTQTRTFAERYFQVQHTDLLFADAAIFVEGTAERMLVPFFIDRDFANLQRRYLSFLEIGGSHAHRLKPLVERLGIPTVVITDIDPVRPSEDANGRATKKAEAITNCIGLECGNDTLTQWHPKKPNLSDFESADPVWAGDVEYKVRFAWQKPIPFGGLNPWPSSFEDAFILTNLDWFKKRSNDTGTLGSVARKVAEQPDPIELDKALHELLHGRSFKKGDFAATLFEHLCAEEKLRCPDYIADALKWLEDELDPTKNGGPA